MLDIYFKFTFLNNSKYLHSQYIGWFHKMKQYKKYYLPSKLFFFYLTYDFSLLTGTKASEMNFTRNFACDMLSDFRE